MNWLAVSSIAEAVGVIFVFISVVYLALQVRQNTHAIKASSHHAITDSFNSISALVAQDPQIGRLWRLGSEKLSNLTEDEQVSYSFICIMYMRVMETLYYQKKVGTMEEQLFDTEEQTLHVFFAFPGMREWWKANPYSFSTEYRNHINTIIEEVDASA